MPGRNDIWGNLNTLFEIGVEIYRIMRQTNSAKGASKDAEVEKIADGVLLISNDKEILIAVGKETANQDLSEAAIELGFEKGDYLVYGGAAAAGPLFELSRISAAVWDSIYSFDSLKATLCANYPEYVKTHNMTAPSGERIENADAPPYLFLQKQLDNAADATRSEVNAFQETHARESVFERSRMDDVLELER